MTPPEIAIMVTTITAFSNINTMDVATNHMDELKYVINNINKLYDTTDSVAIEGKNNKQFINISLIMYLAKIGNYDLLKYLSKYDYRVDWNARNNQGYNVFIYACIHGHTNIVKLLLDMLYENNMSIIIQSEDHHRLNGLVHASIHGHLDIVKLLKSKIHLYNEYNPLMYAVKYNHKDIVKYLLIKDMLIERPNGTKEFISEYAMPVNTYDHTIDDIMTLAIKNNDPELVSILLNGPIDIDAGGKTQKNPGPTPPPHPVYFKNVKYNRN